MTVYVFPEGPGHAQDRGSGSRQEGVRGGPCVRGWGWGSHASPPGPRMLLALGGRGHPRPSPPARVLGNHTASMAEPQSPLSTCRSHGRSDFSSAPSLRSGAVRITAPSVFQFRNPGDKWQSIYCYNVEFLIPSKIDPRNLGTG